MLYDLIVANNKTGKQITLNNNLTLKQAQTIKSKCYNYPGRTITITENTTSLLADELEAESIEQYYASLNFN